MKKLTAFLSALALGLTAAPMTAFAETSDDTAAAEIQMGDVTLTDVLTLLMLLLRFVIIHQ